MKRSKSRRKAFIDWQKREPKKGLFLRFRRVVWRLREPLYP